MRELQPIWQNKFTLLTHKNENELFYQSMNGTKPALQKVTLWKNRYASKSFLQSKSDMNLVLRRNKAATFSNYKPQDFLHQARELQKISVLCFFTQLITSCALWEPMIQLQTRKQSILLCLAQIVAFSA